MSDADWEPLPKEALCHNPGEFVAVGKRTVPSPPPVAAPAPMPVPVEADPESQRALQALQQRLAARPAAARIELPEVAAADPPMASSAAAEPGSAWQAWLAYWFGEAAAAADTAEAVPAPFPVVVGERLRGRDARELQPWFRELGEREQARLRAVWRARRRRFRWLGIAALRRLLRAFTHAALVLGALGVLQSVLLGGFALLPMLAFAGGVAGAAAEFLRGERFLYAIAGGFAWAFVMRDVLLQQPFALPGLLLAAFGLGAVGMEGEMRRSGGYPAS